MPWGMKERMGPFTRAQWPFECPGCGVDVEEGDTIVCIDDEWVCEDCGTA